MMAGRALSHSLICGALTICLGVVLGAASVSPASAKRSKHGVKHSAGNAAIKLQSAKVETLDFATMPGWKDDDHAAAYDVFLKSCTAILRGTKQMRAARPVYGALFNVCERAGRTLAPQFAGLTMAEASKNVLGLMPSAQRARGRRVLVDAGQ